MMAAMRSDRGEDARRQGRALAAVTESASEVASRVAQVEERVVPDVQRYVDKKQEDYWAPTRTEINAVRADVKELRARIDQVDTSATELIVSTREEAAKDRKAVREERVAAAAASLSRLQLLDRAVNEEREARVAAVGGVRREMEGMAAAIAESIRDADAEHVGLVEAVHKRVLARIAQMGDVAAVVQEALESKRAFLEEVVRAEIASRFAAMEQLSSDVAAREAAQAAALQAAKEELEAQVKLMQVKVKANGRALRSQGAAVEAVRRVVEQARVESEAELLSVSRTQAQAEEELRESVKTQMGDVHIQLGALRDMVQGLSAGADVTQEERDLGQDEKIEKMRVAIAEGAARLDSVADAHAQAHAKVEKQLGELTRTQAAHKDETADKLGALGIAAEALRENFQARLAATDQHVQDVRVQMIDVLRDMQEGPEALFGKAQQRADELAAALEALRAGTEDRCRRVYI